MNSPFHLDMHNFTTTSSFVVTSFIAAAFVIKPSFDAVTLLPIVVRPSFVIEPSSAIALPSYLGPSLTFVQASSLVVIASSLAMAVAVRC